MPLSLPEPLPVLTEEDVRMMVSGIAIVYRLRSQYLKMREDETANRAVTMERIRHVETNLLSRYRLRLNSWPGE